MNAMQMFSLPDGGTFYAHKKHSAGDATMSNEEIVAFVQEKWYEMFEAKRAETDRLKRLDLYYMGRHYKDAALNRRMGVTNYCFSTVQTLWPQLTNNIPRPEIRPREYRAKDRLTDLQAFAQWKMDSVAWDRAFRVGTLDFCKFGWNAHIITIDGKTGLSAPKYLSPYHFYPDANARDESEMECFAVAMPVSTRRLRAMFPDHAHLIQPDNIASPEYEVHVTSRLEEMDQGAIWPSMIASSALPFTKEGAARPSGSTYIVGADGHRIQYGQTTFYIQLFVRDHSRRTVLYEGDKVTADGASWPHTMRKDEPATESGWRMFGVTADGLVLVPGEAVDNCFGGIPVVLARNYADGNWFYAYGEQDHIIPIVRDINRRNALIARALELSSNPPVKAFKNSGLAANTRAISDGEVLWLNQGHDIGYMEYRGPNDKQFEYNVLRTRDVDVVSGQHDVTRGQRPAGIEAASAIRLLQQAASARAQAKQPELLYSYTVLLKKLLIADGKKASPRLTFYGADGRDHRIEAEELLYDFDIRWAEGSGNEAARQMWEEKILNAFQLGLVDEEYVIRELQFKDAENLIARMKLRKQQELMIQIEAAKSGAQSDGGGKPPKKKAAPQGAAA